MAACGSQKCLQVHSFPLGIILRISDVEAHMTCVSPESVRKMSVGC